MDIITSSKITSLPAITDDSVRIEQVTEAKLLGIVISSSLKWNLQADSSAQKASRRLFSLIQLRGVGVPPSILWQYHIAFTRSVILYAYPAWANCNKGSWDRLAKIDRRAEKIIGTAPRLSLQEAADSLCLNLMRSVAKSPNHPLSEIVI